MIPLTTPFPPRSAPARPCFVSRPALALASAVLAVVTSVWAPQAQGAGRDSLTVAQCVAAARRIAPAVRAAGLDVAAARGDSSASASNRKPTVALIAGALVAPQSFYDPVITNLGEYELKLGLDWTATDGGRLSRVRRRSTLDLLAANQRASMEMRDAGLEAARLAIQTLRAEEEVGAQRGALEWLDRLARLVRAGVGAGTRSPADTMRIDLESDAAASALESALLDLRIARIDLGKLIGVADAESVAVRPDNGESDRAPDAADSTRLLATVEGRPELRLAGLQAERTKLDLLDARSAKAPTLDFSLDAGLAGADLTHAVPPDLLAEDPNATFSDRLRHDLGASAALHLRLPVVDATARGSQRARQSALEAQGVRRGGEATRVRAEAIALFERWRVAYRRLELARASLGRADTNLLHVKSLYTAGATPLFDVLDARRVYEDARARFADARADSRALQFEVEDYR
jgi:outer membrane protein TolC